MSNNFLEKIDSIADEVSPVNRLNFESHKEYKSKLGGLCTIFIYLAFIFSWNNHVPMEPFHLLILLNRKLDLGRRR